MQDGDAFENGEIVTTPFRASSSFTVYDDLEITRALLLRMNQPKNSSETSVSILDCFKNLFRCKQETSYVNSILTALDKVSDFLITFTDLKMPEAEEERSLVKKNVVAVAKDAVCFIEDFMSSFLEVNPNKALVYENDEKNYVAFPNLLRKKCSYNALALMVFNGDVDRLVCSLRFMVQAHKFFKYWQYLLSKQDK